MKIRYIVGLMLFGMLNTTYIYAQNDIYSGCTGQFFNLTAYYSPMSGQDYYVHDTYQQDITLNGKGTHGASGKPVFDGMIAAPRKYSFGTKVILPGFGIGEVSDRGGAIVAGSGGDRIDIRAGKGVLGIRRAYGMGPVGITGYICSGDIYDGNLGFVRPEYDDSYDDVVFWTLNQSPGRQDLMVAKLQYILAKYGYLTGGFENANYDEATRIGVCNYQIKKNIYTEYSDDCGTWGPKTRVLFKTDLFGTNIKMDVSNIYKQNILTSSQIAKEEIAKAKVVEPKIVKSEIPNSKIDSKAKTSSKEKPKIKIATKKINLSNTGKSENTANINKKLPEKYDIYFDTPLDEGSKNKSVKILQNILLSEGIEVKKTGIMDEQTKSAVYGLQLKYKLITPSDKSELKGYMGPSTRILLNKLYTLLK